MADLITVAQGLSSTWTVTIRGPSGAAYTGYTGAEGLTGTVRVGRDTTPLIVLAPTWLDATLGTIALPIPGAVTRDLETGRYLVQIALADGSADLFEGFLQVNYSPGTAAALPTYGSYGDLLDRAPWIATLQKNTDLAGFARQRNQARAWFEDLVHRHDRGGSGLSTDFAFVPGISFGGEFGMGYRGGGKSRELQTWLDAGRLDLTTQVIDAVSCFAIALVCQRQISSAGSDGYERAARKWFAMAEAVAQMITAEIDSNGDGVNDYTISLNSHDTLEG
jgi:hypothetical protein